MKFLLLVLLSTLSVAQDHELESFLIRKAGLLDLSLSNNSSTTWLDVDLTGSFGKKIAFDSETKIEKYSIDEDQEQKMVLGLGKIIKHQDGTVIGILGQIGLDGLKDDELGVEKQRVTMGPKVLISFGDQGLELAGSMRMALKGDFFHMRAFGTYCISDAWSIEAEACKTIGQNGIGEDFVRGTMRLNAVYNLHNNLQLGPYLGYVQTSGVNEEMTPAIGITLKLGRGLL